MKTRWLIVVLALLLSGCASNMKEYVDAMAKDQANLCVAISTPYGGGVAGRVNTPGVKLNISGGQCTLDSMSVPVPAPMPALTSPVR